MVVSFDEDATNKPTTEDPLNPAPDRTAKEQAVKATEGYILKVVC